MSAVAYLQHIGVAPPPAGVSEYSTTCPMCSHKRSKSDAACLSVKLEQGKALYNCFHCGWKGGVGGNGGGVQWGGVEAALAVNAALSTAGPPKREFMPPPHRFVRHLGPESRAFFERRGISYATTARFDVREVVRRFPQADGPMLAIVFPYEDGGVLVNRKFRAVGEKMFMQERGTRRTLFNVDAARLFQDVGDCRGRDGRAGAGFEAGVQCAVSLPDGAGKNGNAKRVAALRESGLLTGGRRLWLAGDMDEAGRGLKKAMRGGGQARWTLSQSMWAWPAGCKDANEMLMAERA